MCCCAPSEMGLSVVTCADCSTKQCERRRNWTSEGDLWGADQNQQAPAASRELAAGAWLWAGLSPPAGLASDRFSWQPRSRAWARLGPLSVTALFERAVAQTVGRDCIRRGRHPTGWHGGFPTGRPWAFASNRVTPRQRGENRIAGGNLPFPDPVPRIARISSAVAGRLGRAGSGVPRVEGLSPRGAARHWRRH